MGRHMKYSGFLEILEDETIYSPATIVAAGEAMGLLNNDPDSEELKKQKIKIRHSLGHFSKNHNFPREGDGMIPEQLKGQSPQRGWYGRRWKEPLQKKQQHRQDAEQEHPPASHPLETPSHSQSN